MKGTSDYTNRALVDEHILELLCFWQNYLGFPLFRNEHDGNKKNKETHRQTTLQ